MELKVLHIQKNGNVVVSGRGLRRIVDYPGGKVAMELVPANEAARIVKLHNDCFPDGSHWCEAFKYGEPIKSRRRRRSRAKITA